VVFTLVAMWITVTVYIWNGGVLRIGDLTLYNAGIDLCLEGNDVRITINVKTTARKKDDLNSLDIL